MGRLILIEGLPGTGKTTISQWLFDLLQSKGESFTLLFEDDKRIACNFYYIAGVPKDIFYNSFSDKITSFDSINKKTENFVYCRIDKAPKDIRQELSRWDIGDEFNKELSLQEYIECTLEWWENWVNDNTEQQIIMDSAFMQCPINEMIFRKATNAQIKSYISVIADLLKPFSPVCIYLRRSSAIESIEFAKAAKGPIWSAGINRLKEMGCADLFERRFDIEFEMLSTMKHIVCEINGSDWSLAKDQIQNFFVK